MDPAHELRKVIWQLNTEGGFFHSLQFDRIAESAAGLPLPVVQKVLDSCAASRDDILDHNHFVCSELERQKQTHGGVGTVYLLPGGFGGDDSSLDQDWELWDRVKRMNTDGGFANSIRYEDIVNAARGVETSAVILILSHLEDKWQEVNDPTSWVCAALHKKRNGKGAKGVGGKGQEGGQWQPGYAEQWGQPSHDSRISERVAWLNGEGGFGDVLKYDQIAAAAAGLDAALVMKILSHLVDRKGEVHDPTSWVCAALTKEHANKGKGWQKGGGSWNEPGWGQWQGHGGGQWQEKGGGEGSALDRELRRRIAWLNNEGGFNNTITYREISEAAAGLDVAVVMKLFNQLEERRAEITNPTTWIIDSLWQERDSRGCGGGSNKGSGKGSGAGKGPPINVPTPPPVQKTITKK
mmetsp:Transcript_2608/g.8032  ORF Transcript_2608/g.8032 Transcript_2608/m.8032 type:complete len:409 (+) Transcript_2608:146-1372(+)